ncbi:MAG: extracellular solute-binding protein [Prochlorococcaceae cyanobacterium]
MRPPPLLPALLSGLLLAGCGAPARTTVFLAYGVNRDETLDTKLQTSLRERIGELQTAFEAVQPGVTIKVLVLPEGQVVEQLHRRRRTGLSPDLITVNGSTALELQRQGLLRPVRLAESVVRPLDPGMRRQLRLGGGELAALPLVLQPQMACFHRGRLARSPASLEELLQAAAAGARGGLPLDPLSLAWTSGATGAAPVLNGLMAGRPPDPAGRHELERWLTWLLGAELQQQVTFYRDQDQLRELLMADGLDWITCRSHQLGELRQRLGDQLGVAPLPAGAGGPPSPLSRQRVLAFGRDSSPAQARAAEALASFAVSPLIQRSLTLTSLDLLPANRPVTPPAAPGSTLAVLLTAQAQADAQPPDSWMNRVTPLQEPRLQALLVGLLFGEVTPAQATDQLITLLGQGR